MDQKLEKIQSLALDVLNSLKMKDLTLSTAESATGGMVSNLLTNIPGCSKFFIGGVVCYTAQAKNHFLDVDWEIINDFGTVSPEVVESMLEGLKKLGADIQLAITGVAGSPIEGRPTGLIYVGISTQTHTEVKEFSFTGSRIEIKIQAVEKAFNILLDELAKL